MTRRKLLVFSGAIAIFAAAIWGGQERPQRLLVLEWMSQSRASAPPTAILVEFGLTDVRPTDWSGKATVSGASIVGREGYRFRPTAGDKLVEPNSWSVSSHRGMRAPPRQPALAKVEPLATVGVVLHLTDVRLEAELIVELTGAEKAKVAVPLKDVVAGKSAPILDGRARVRLISAALPLATGKTEDDFPAACYGPDGSLWVAWIGYHVKDESRRIEQKSLKQQPPDFKAYLTTEFGDQLFVKRHRDGQWSDPIAITGASEDLCRCAIAADSSGKVTVVYSAHRNGSFQLFARAFGADGKLGKEHQLTGVSARDHSVSYLSPVMVTDQSGQLHVAAQSWQKSGQSAVAHIIGLSLDDSGWTSRMSGSGGRGNSWGVAITAGPKGEWQVACDAYVGGDYDVDLPFEGTATRASGGRHSPVAESSRFEARPSIVFDSTGRLWIAYEEGPELWGKDYGALDDSDGSPLYSSRSVRVVCRHNGKVFQAPELPTASVANPKMPFDGPTFERAARYSNPQLGIDGKGRIWLTYRQKFGTRYSSHPGSYWLTFARRLDGDHWSEPIELHHSCGLLDHRPVLLPHKAGGIVVIHNTDGRFTTPESIDNDIYVSYLDLPGDPVEPLLKAKELEGKRKEATLRDADENRAVEAIRNYSLNLAGKSYRLLRGEFHRHTELSWDGGPDGSLEDMFRYAIDAAKMDWIGNGDHDNGAGREYSWWLVQKFTDAYHVPSRFTPMFCYERSVAYPHGHRNCVFAKRGVRTLPRLSEADETKRIAGIHADDTKMLYRYLRELGGVCASHTSATSMGTDWRDNDPTVEPFVEIYQGDRMSYEKEGAPRAGYEPKSGKAPANIAGWFPKGFIDHALGEKGYRLGFQASSDHWSTHISYCIVVAESPDREGILNAMRKRHVYGATDDIICDIRCGRHMMGDELETRDPPTLQLRIIGTGDIHRIVIMRDSKQAAVLRPMSRDYSGDWKDPEPSAGIHYYYVRVEQKNGELAWTSPLWIDYRK
jgi:hypothetical protein